ncbi:predicted protein [Sclerotinia sclerotiorum 1980 UF-70]|uniref:Uncharacterized protein n=1 Tax=Sclerotinia sclerotiorum (strain ATCC 18683 / 1980 / Ss-1) TaxID=665079 RepID=A7EK86_SCLS1|nr:predicted protein [Sclerotinia sclerotiorum 1980 UF-70]EDO03252.1 predicted protein [Sclerotinia sclerotiorum 1980 UF-70]
MVMRLFTDRIFHTSPAFVGITQIPAEERNLGSLIVTSGSSAAKLKQTDAFQGYSTMRAPAERTAEQRSFQTTL